VQYFQKVTEFLYEKPSFLPFFLEQGLLFSLLVLLLACTALVLFSGVLTLI